MNFVNKLSVISLLVLMFSFMNIATADTAICKGTRLTYCNKATTQSACEGSWRNGGTKASQCLWVNGTTAGTFTCSASSTACYVGCNTDNECTKKGFDQFAVCNPAHICEQPG